MSAVGSARTGARAQGTPAETTVAARSDLTSRPGSDATPGPDSSPGGGAGIRVRDDWAAVRGSASAVRAFLAGGALDALAAVLAFAGDAELRRLARHLVAPGVDARAFPGARLTGSAGTARAGRHARPVVANLGRGTGDAPARVDALADPADLPHGADHVLAAADARPLVASLFGPAGHTDARRILAELIGLVGDGKNEPRGAGA